MKQTKFIFLVLFCLLLIPVLVNGQISTTASTKTIEISHDQIQTVEIHTQPAETRICPAGCTCNGEVTNCQVVPSCQSPCTMSDDTCTCPSEQEQDQTCKVGCTCVGNTMTCPVENNCKLPCTISGDTCTCPSEQAVAEDLDQTCKVGCTCSGNTTTCPVEETKPTEVKISSLESGVESVSIEKVPNGLSLQSEKATAVTTGRLISEGNNLFLKTSTGNKEIKVLPEEASSKATAITSVSTIELKEESQRPIYSVKGTKQAKLLFVIPVSMKIETKVSAESGDVISVKKPWWSFLTR